MSVTTGPFIMCFIAVIILTVYTYVIIYVRKGLLYQNMKFAFTVISLILIRMLLPFNFPFTVSIYSDKFLSWVNIHLFYHIGGGSLRPADIIFWIWLAGAVIKFICFLHTRIRYRKYLEMFLIKDMNEYPELKKTLKECGAPDWMKVCRLPNNISPSMFGTWHPILLLPDKEFDSHELYFVCRHEIAHYKNHDLWLHLFLELVVCVQWFNPLAYLLEKELTLAFEVANDQIVLADCSELERTEYANYVVAALSEKREKAGGNVISFVSSDRPESKTRLEYILAKKEERTVKKRNIWPHYVFVVALFLVSLFVVPEGYITETIDNEGAVDISENNSYIVKRGMEYQLYVDGEYLFTLSPLPEEFKNIPIIEENEHET